MDATWQQGLRVPNFAVSFSSQIPFIQLASTEQVTTESLMLKTASIHSNHFLSIEIKI